MAINRRRAIVLCTIDVVRVHVGEGRIQQLAFSSNPHMPMSRERKRIEVEVARS
jgi:hypothetical protein